MEQCICKSGIYILVRAPITVDYQLLHIISQALYVVCEIRCKAVNRQFPLCLMTEITK